MITGLNFHSDVALMYKARSYPYTAIAARTVRPIDVNDLKPHVKIDFLDETQENYLNLLIDAAVDRAEKFCNRCFINQKWRTFRDYFMWFITLERGGQVTTLDDFQYLNTAGDWTVVDPDVYYLSVKEPYSQIILEDGFLFPPDILDRQSSVKIEFTTGYGETKASIPPSLRLLLCQHVAWLYENKGNCPVDAMPKMVEDGYKSSFRVVDINASTYI